MWRTDVVDHIGIGVPDLAAALRHDAHPHGSLLGGVGPGRNED